MTVGLGKEDTDRGQDGLGSHQQDQHRPAYETGIKMMELSWVKKPTLHCNQCIHRFVTVEVLFDIFWSKVCHAFFRCQSKKAVKLQKKNSSTYTSMAKKMTNPSSNWTGTGFLTTALFQQSEIIHKRIKTRSRRHIGATTHGVFPQYLVSLIGLQQVSVVTNKYFLNIDGAKQ